MQYASKSLTSMLIFLAMEEKELGWWESYLWAHKYSKVAEFNGEKKLIPESNRSLCISEAENN